MGNITFRKSIQERNEDNKEAFIYLHDTYERDYQFYCQWTDRYEDLTGVSLGLGLNTSYKEIRNHRDEFVKNELSLCIGSLSDNNPIRKTIPNTNKIVGKVEVLRMLRVKFIYEDGEWKFEELTNSIEDFVKDMLWYSLQHHRQLFKQLHEEIEKHPNKEHFQSIPKSILEFPAIKAAMQKLLDSNVEIKGDAPDSQPGLIHLYRNKMSVDEMEMQLLMEDPHQKMYEERERAVSQMVEEARNNPQKCAHGEVSGMHMDLQISENF